MKKAIFVFLSLLMAGYSKEPLINEKGELSESFIQLLQACDLPQGSSLEETALITKQAWIQVGKERWEYEERFNDKQEAALPLLKRLGCFEAVNAKESHYDYAIVLGALLSRVAARLDFLFEEWQRGVRFSTLVFLTGERDISPDKELVPEGIETETEMMLYLYHNHPLCAVTRHLPLLVVHTPKQPSLLGLLVRPNTADTVNAWLATRPTPGSCLAVSDQPFVLYQEAVLRYLLPPSFKLEVVGAADPGKYPLILYLDNLAKWFCYELMIKLSGARSDGQP